MRERLRGSEGFTLIELLVVVIIIGVLASFAIPAFLGAQTSARDSGIKSDLANAKIFMVSAYTKDGAYPATVAALKTTGWKPSSKTSDGYVVNWELFNVSKAGFCLRAWADLPEGARDLWVSGSSGVVGPILVSEVAKRPEGCPTT